MESHRPNFSITSPKGTPYDPETDEDQNGYIALIAVDRNTASRLHDMLQLYNDWRSSFASQLLDLIREADLDRYNYLMEMGKSDLANMILDMERGS